MVYADEMADQGLLSETNVQQLNAIRVGNLCVIGMV